MEEELKTKKTFKDYLVIFKSTGALKLYSSLICIVISLILGYILTLCFDAINATREFMNMLSGGMTFNSANFFAILGKSAPLICCGLSIVFANKTGMFNIGVAGQYTIGILGSLMFALQFNWPWYACILMALIFGAIWGSIPGILKAYCNVNEVISGIMLNWIGLFFTNYSFQTYLSGCVDVQAGSKTYELSRANPSARIPDLGLSSQTGGYFTIAIFIALIAAVLIWLILSKTTLGYQLKASGFNKDATKYAGIKDKRNIIISLAISGALAGLGASLYYLAGLETWTVQASSSLPGLPWNGIVVAFVGQLTPIGAVLSSVFITMITHGATFMLQTSFPKEIGSFITGVIVYLSGLTNLAVILLNKYVFNRTKKEEVSENGESTLQIEGSNVEENSKKKSKFSEVWEKIIDKIKSFLPEKKEENNEEISSIESSNEEVTIEETPTSSESKNDEEVVENSKEDK